MLRADRKMTLKGAFVFKNQTMCTKNEHTKNDVAWMNMKIAKMEQYHIIVCAIENATNTTQPRLKKGSENLCLDQANKYIQLNYRPM